MFGRHRYQESAHNVADASTSAPAAAEALPSDAPAAAAAPARPRWAQPAKQQQQQQQQSLFIDAITGRHASPAGAQPLLDRRRMAWAPAHGWVYDAWPARSDLPAHALAGANSRFSLPAIAGRVADLVADVARPAAGAWRGAVERLPPAWRQRLPGGGSGGDSGSAS